MNTKNSENKKRGYAIAIGSNSMDHYYYAKSWPELGDKAMIEEGEVLVGGLISNAACVMASCGIETYMIDVVSDQAKDRIREELEHYGVKTGLIREVTGYKQSMTQTYVVEGEKVVLICKKKPEIELTEEQRSLITHASIIYSILPELRLIDNYRDVIKEVKENGGKLVFDMETPTFDLTQRDFDLMCEANILFFNEMAINKLRDKYAEETIIQKLFEKGVEIIVITRAERGCCVYGKTETIELIGHKVQVVDTTGAGDAFNSIFLASHLRGDSLGKSAQLANAAGARAVTMKGPKSGAASLEMVEDYLGRL